jgi:hypothetical protein
MITGPAELIAASNRSYGTSGPRSSGMASDGAFMRSSPWLGSRGSAKIVISHLLRCLFLPVRSGEAADHIGGDH